MLKDLDSDQNLQTEKPCLYSDITHQSKKQNLLHAFSRSKYM